LRRNQGLPDVPVNRIQASEALIDMVTEWARLSEKVAALALVGSYAVGRQHEKSDVDLIAIAAGEKQVLLADRRWLDTFGKKQSKEEIEDWGKLTSIRVCYKNNVELEFGIANSDWTEIPSDPGTSQVVSDGMKILYDPADSRRRLKQHCQKIEKQRTDGGNSQPELGE